MFVYVVTQMLLATPGAAQAESEGRTRASASERRHAVEVEIGPLRTAGALVLVCVGAVAVLVHALRRFVRIIVTYLFILLLLFNTGETKKRTHTEAVARLFTFARSQKNLADLLWKIALI